ncbi:MAG: type II toxin-antitoxin system RelE/ParE family toxin [Phycisphaerae bacterium]|nr:type II toxin-antitoxin system RelE/ParE family toxin [Phycisphaerae bacterium]
MRTAFKRTFLKDVEALGDAATRQRIREVITQVESAAKLQDIQGVKRLKGDDHCYRIRIGDYRLGLLIEEGTAVFVRCLHRRDIYRYFP